MDEWVRIVSDCYLGGRNVSIIRNALGWIRSISETVMYRVYVQGGWEIIRYVYPAFRVALKSMNTRQYIRLVRRERTWRKSRFFFAIERVL